MKPRLALLIGLLSISFTSFSAPFLKFKKDIMTMPHCQIEETNNTLDLALLNEGYFVIQQAGSYSDEFFTRHGVFSLNLKGYVVNEDGEYLMRQIESGTLSYLDKIKIPVKDLAPKPTSKAKFRFNLSANTPIDESFNTSIAIYDSLSTKHDMTLNFIKQSSYTWKLMVSIDDTEVAQKAIHFNSQGQMENPNEGVDVPWNLNQSTQNIAISLKGTTQYASYSYSHGKQNGYGVGSINGLSISHDGKILLSYTNGITKEMDGNIAVAKFKNPASLEHYFNHLFKATASSGQAMIDASNSNFAIWSGAVENHPCDNPKIIQ